MKFTLKYSLTAICLLGGCMLSSIAYSEEAVSSPMQMLAAKTETTTNPTTSVPVTEKPSVADQMPTQRVMPVSETPAEQSVIDCNYIVPEPISQMSADTIVQWADYTALKTFTYDFQNYDKQFQKLKPCYTSIGWESFLKAMKSSNNLKTAQEEHLFVSAKINGKSQLTAQSSGNEQPAWVVRVPINVTYQNQDREVTQDMYIDLTIKTIYGSPVRLGVNQIIASPK
jgi:hypothetical protein